MLRIICCLVFLISLQICPVLAQDQKRSTLNTISLADPTIFYHKGTYYLYGTGGDKYTNQGFVVYTSADLKTWEGPRGAAGGYALRKGDAFGESGFWAPQVFEYKNKFYMAYTANEHIAIAVSSSPLGPFRQQDKKPLINQKRNIDPFIFIDDDGKKYLYHVIVADGGNRIYTAELEDDFSGIKENTVKKCIEADREWENTDHAKWSVTEGPTVLKHKQYYYLIYSANDFRNPDYAVSYAMSKNPLGPWEKTDQEPLISRKTIGHNGTGHGDLFTGRSGNMYYVFHTHNSESKVAPRLTAVVKAGFAGKRQGPDKFIIDADSFYFLQQNRKSK